MKTISPMLMVMMLLAGCAAPRVMPQLAERQKKYLADLPRERTRPWGPCECTYHFLADTGAAGVPGVIQALDRFSGPTNVSMRALIVDGAWHYSGGTNAIVVPIMEHATRDLASAVSDVAKKWLYPRCDK